MHCLSHELAPGGLAFEDLSQSHSRLASLSSRPDEDPGVTGLAKKGLDREEMIRMLERNVPLHGAIQQRLGKVIAAAVGTAGGLFRFRLAFEMAQAFGASQRDSENLACGVEFYHIASLLLDDLPQMDDSTERRGKTCAHLLYGEEMVILGALGLITRGYSLLGQTICSAPLDRRLSANALVEQCLGTAGILNGQARDLDFNKNGGSQREAIAVAAGKTAPLIQLALSMPALVSGADNRTLLILRRLSVFWGLFYQGVDDLKDLLEKSFMSGKTPGRDAELGRPNIALVAGYQQTNRYLGRLDRLANQCVLELRDLHRGLEFLSCYQQMLRSRWEALIVSSSALERRPEAEAYHLVEATSPRLSRFTRPHDRGAAHSSKSEEPSLPL